MSSATSDRSSVVIGLRSTCLPSQDADLEEVLACCGENRRSLLCEDVQPPRVESGSHPLLWLELERGRRKGLDDPVTDEEVDYGLTAERLGHVDACRDSVAFAELDVNVLGAHADEARAASGKSRLHGRCGDAGCNGHAEVGVDDVERAV